MLRRRFLSEDAQSRRLHYEQHECQKAERTFRARCSLPCDTFLRKTIDSPRSPSPMKPYQSS